MSDVGPFGDIEETLAHRRAEHHVLCETSEWKAASRYLGHVVEDFVALVNAAAWAFTRYPDGHKWLLQSAMDEFVESAVGCLFLADSGALNVAQRELRYVLEVAIPRPQPIIPPTMVPLPRVAASERVETNAPSSPSARQLSA